MVSGEHLGNIWGTLLQKKSRKRSERQHKVNRQSDAGSPDCWCSTPKKEK
jgi:hypothetical protein